MGAAVLYLLCPGWDPSVWYPAGWSWRPSGDWAEEGHPQNRVHLSGETLNSSCLAERVSSVIFSLSVFQSLNFFHSSFSCFPLSPSEMEGESYYCSSHLSHTLHPVGGSTLRCRANAGVSGGGEVDSPGGVLLCCHHPDYSGFWRLCCRYFRHCI